MNRRDFLRSAAAATVGATSTIIIPGAAAEEILETGKTMIKEESIVNEGKIISQEEYVQEVVEVASLGDNLAHLILNSSGPITLHQEKVQGLHMIYVHGRTYAHDAFKQHGKYKLVQASRHNINYRGGL